ncbi:MAG: type II/IV secretion system ATPase subunit [Candidatus Aenigmatarchaeota archaeon]
MADGCKHSTETVKGKKVLYVECRDCLLNASLSNPKCRESILAAVKDEKPDKLILKNRFMRVYGKDSLQALHELDRMANVNRRQLEGLEEGFCEKCRPQLEGLRKLADDPIKFFYGIYDIRLCEGCDETVGKELRKLASEMRETDIIKTAVKTGDVRETYHKILKASLVPDLVSSHIEQAPPEGDPIEDYSIGNVKISVYGQSNRPDKLMFVKYPEFKLSNLEMKALNATFRRICKAKPEADFTAPGMRKLITRIAGESLEDFDNREVLTEILLRHTAGYGLIEPLLADKGLQDVYVDSGSRIVHVVHEKHGECMTNIVLSAEDLEKLATRLRAVSGRPFDASSPVLHAELEEYGVRVAGICEPSTYSGIGFAFRRRKSDPWTLTELARRGMFDAETAGLLSYVMDGQSSMLIVGPRSSGKTSMLTALLLEINQNNRIIIIEDTPEVPISHLRTMGYKIEHLKTEAFAKGYELSAEEALRTSLRLGESILVLGEVRGPEARSLFEAMRIGAVGNVVLGTIHGSGPYDVWDRITNDLKVPSTSFKATDLILTTGTIRKGDSTEKVRRLFGVTEVRKDWTSEPKFSEIMSYSRKGDRMRLEDLSRSETIKKIARLKGTSVADAKANIALRARMKRELIKRGLTSAEWTVASNNQYVMLAREHGKNYNKIFKAWKSWIGKA